jgi:hypothetical protein
MFDFMLMWIINKQQSEEKILTSKMIQIGT